MVRANFILGEHAEFFLVDVVVGNVEGKKLITHGFDHASWAAEEDVG